VIAAAALAVLAAALRRRRSTTYNHKDYKFSVTYDSSPADGEHVHVGRPRAGGKSVFDVGFVDPKGTKIGGSIRDGMNRQHLQAHPDGHRLHAAAGEDQLEASCLS